MTEYYIRLPMHTADDTARRPYEFCDTREALLERLAQLYCGEAFERDGRKGTPRFIGYVLEGKVTIA